MRVARVLAAGAMVVAVAACGDSTGITVEDLVGTWEATEIVFTNSANTSESVDVIDLGASLTVTINSAGTVSTVFDDGQGGTDSDSGTLSVDGSTLTVGGETFEAERSGDVLILTGDGEWDFDEDGTDDPATLTIRLVRQ
ncbi:MAG TPA: hypothetical protein VGA02_10225 [Gemmatimonadales bacterium]